MTTAKERLDQILEEKNFTVQELSDNLGISRHIISSVKNNQTRNITIELSDKIVSVFPEYSELWLLTGKEPKYTNQVAGDMNFDVDMSSGKRENSGSGNYFEGTDAATIRLQVENEHLKADIKHLKELLEKSETERRELLDKLLNK